MILSPPLLRSSPVLPVGGIFFFFNDTATTEIYTLSLHDALPIWPSNRIPQRRRRRAIQRRPPLRRGIAIRRRRRGPARRAIGRAHVWTPVTATYPMPSSA